MRVAAGPVRIAQPPAVFVDKDGTLVENVPFNVDPGRIRLARGAAEGLSLLASAGYRIVVVSNQPGVARGRFEPAALAGVERQLRLLLAGSGVALAGFYCCPHDPEGSVARYRRSCDCRKPAPGMILGAARELGLRLEDSWMIGDILDDVEAGSRAGCHTILIDNGGETEWREGPGRRPDVVAPDLHAAARTILATRATTAQARDESRDWAGVRNLLCVRLDAMGDVLMTAPAIRAAKHAGTRRRVTVLTSPSGAAAASLLPDVDDVIVHAAPWVKGNEQAGDGAAERDLVARLAARNFDAAVIFTVYSQSPLPAALLCHLADIPRRLAHCRENAYRLLTTAIREPEPDTLLRHETRRQLDLVRAVGWQTDDERLAVALPAAARESAARRLAAAGFDDAKPWAVLHPGASAPSRRYGIDGFARAARTLAREHGWRFVLTGTAAERPLLDRLLSALPDGAAMAACSLPLAELAALIERAAVLIANNTGPVHLAAAVGTPVVDLYALTNLQHTPWQVPSRVLFRDVPCRCCYRSVCPEGHHGCLQAVPSRDVVAAALELAAPSPRCRAAEDLPADFVRLAAIDRARGGFGSRSRRAARQPNAGSAAQECG